MWAWVFKPILTFVLFIGLIFDIIDLPSNWKTEYPMLEQIYTDPVRIIIAIVILGIIGWLYWPQIRAMKEKNEKYPSAIPHSNEYYRWSVEDDLIAIKHRKPFWDLIQDAYVKHRDLWGQSLPPKIEDLLMRVSFPDQLPLSGDTDLIEWAKPAVEKLQGEQSELWKFVFGVYPIELNSDGTLQTRNQNVD